jgi:hypothetical protein
MLDKDEDYRHSIHQSGKDRLMIYHGLVLMILRFIFGAGHSIDLPFDSNWPFAIIISAMGTILSLVGLSTRRRLQSTLEYSGADSQSRGDSLALNKKYLTIYKELHKAQKGNIALALVMMALGIIILGVSGPFWLVMGVFQPIDLNSFSLFIIKTPLSSVGISLIISAAIRYHYYYDIRRMRP